MFSPTVRRKERSLLRADDFMAHSMLLFDYLA
jgi:hypothetical protein